MKKTPFLSLFFLTFLLCLNTSFAQTKDKKNNAETRAKIFTEDLIKYLTLNGAQAKQVLAINTEINKKLDAGSKGGNAKALRAERKKKIAALLVGDQKAKFDKLYGGGKDNKEKGKGKVKKNDEDEDDGIFGK
ncbi:MAG: hypothetical protein EAZ31_06665 [Cytophagia bacterium]|nr:MAG: hypothetical protein EAZ31_06665 [Cytophagia bacterium]TAH29643.1 MAG: hypothetical protein EAZ06_06060 [Cytophagales bacterium]